MMSLPHHLARKRRKLKPNRFAIAPLLFLLLFLIFGGVRGFTREIRNPVTDYYVDIPEGWTVLSGSDATQIAFADPQKRAVMQIFSFPGSQFSSAGDIANFVSQRFGVEGDRASFTFSGHDAIFADLSFSTGRIPVRGYHVFIDGERTDYAVMAFAPEEYYESYHDFLLSALDSFSMGQEGRLYPGPVSQFYYAYPPPAPRSMSVTIPVPDHAPVTVNYRLDPAEKEATQVLIEREARILQAYAGDAAQHGARWNGGTAAWVQAWRRYYRLIYKDNFQRLSGLSTAIGDAFSAAGVSHDDVPSLLLSWLQGFRYSRTGSLSDLLGPVSVLSEQRGDCDALGLVYAILLKQLGFDSILLVSSQYAHALAGVDAAGSGARYEFNGSSYLLAEMTDNVRLGMIPSSMADPAGWIAVRLEPAAVPAK